VFFQFREKLPHRVDGAGIEARQAARGREGEFEIFEGKREFCHIVILPPGALDVQR
jgi:hypothetical protein